MPPKRRAPPRSSAAGQSANPPVPKRSKLARENSITAAQEEEIREAFSLFAVHVKPPVSREQDEDMEDADAVLGAGRRRRRGKASATVNEDDDGDDEGMTVLRKEDVRRCLIALDLTPSSSEIRDVLDTLDPTSTGLIHFEPFLSYCALLLNNRASNASSRSSSPSDPSQKHPRRAEIDSAYQLFTHQQNGPITLAHLRRVAKELREEVPDRVLKDMILEANGGIGDEGIRKGVGKEDFEAVMKRAGVFG